MAARTSAQTQTGVRTPGFQGFPVFRTADHIQGEHLLHAAQGGYLIHSLDGSLAGQQIVAGRGFPVLRQPTAVHALHATPAFSVVRQAEHPGHVVHAVHAG